MIGTVYGGVADAPGVPPTQSVIQQHLMPPQKRGTF